MIFLPFYLTPSVIPVCKMLALVLSVLAYLLGSVPTGYLLGSATGVDIRESGSGNIGATNVARTLGWKKGVLTLVLDVAKGLIPAFVALQLNLGIAVAAVAGLAAFLGHLYPIFLRFRGGKGIATALGVFLGTMPLAAVVLVVVFLAVVGSSRRVSLGSVTAAVLSPVLAWFLDYPLPVVWVNLIIGFFALVRHRENLQRLMAGTEAKL